MRLIAPSKCTKCLPACSLGVAHSTTLRDAALVAHDRVERSVDHCSVVGFGEFTRAVRTCRQLKLEHANHRAPDASDLQLRKLGANAAVPSRAKWDPFVAVRFVCVFRVFTCEWVSGIRRSIYATHTKHMGA